MSLYRLCVLKPEGLRGANVARPRPGSRVSMLKGGERFYKILFQRQPLCATCYHPRDAQRDSPCFAVESRVANESEAWVR